MANPSDVDDCKRSVIKIGSENFYLIVGDSFVQCTIPRENDPTMNKTREMVECICAELTRVMELRQLNQKEKA